jgi:hypothetical protein
MVVDCDPDRNEVPRSFVPVVALGLVAVGAIAARKSVCGGMAMMRCLG